MLALSMNEVISAPNSGNPTVFMLCTCIAAAMGGLLFGYEMGIAGGVTSMQSFLIKFYPGVYLAETHNTATNEYCMFNSQQLTRFTSTLYVAALLSSLVASTVTRRFGRRMSMISGSIFYCGCCALNGFASHLWMLMVGKCLLGFGIGLLNQAVPLYLSEMAPHKLRGAINMAFQLFITAGMVVANLLNFFFDKIQGWGWRLSLGGGMVPAIFIIAITIVFLPDTPTSLIERGKLDEAKMLLKRLRGVENMDEEFRSLVAASYASRLVTNSWRNMMTRKFLPQLTMAVSIPFFKQFTGISLIMFYAPVLFKSLGFSSHGSLISTVIVGMVNLAATAVSIYVVDKWGRRSLFLQGGIQMLLAQIALSITIGMKFGVKGEAGDSQKWFTILLVVFVCMYVSAFAWSWGPLGWLIPSEIFPLEIRSAAQSLSVSISMACTFMIAQVLLNMFCHLKFGLFIFFSFFTVLMTMFTWIFLPETKGVPIKETLHLWETHWFWARFSG